MSPTDRSEAFAETAIALSTEGEALLPTLGDVTLDAALSARLAEGSLAGAPAPRHSVLPRMAPTQTGVQLAAADGPRYAQLRALGRGGMGEVALVEDRDIGRHVAVKRLLPEAAHPGMVARFVDEVRTIGRLEHPNIVPIHDVGVDAEGRFFFVMKYLEGETLEAIIERLRSGDAAAHAQYDIPARVAIFAGLMRALDFAHARGYLHRDIKPANVMVGRYGEVVLMDWGVACRKGEAGGGRATSPDAEAAAGADAGPAGGIGATARLSTTQHGALVGTPHYMSPEQARGDNAAIDERSDLFSACVLFHELLGLNHRHARHKSMMAVLVAVNTAEAPTMMSVFEPHPAQTRAVPVEYGHFLVRGLQRDPARRWQSAAEILGELEAIGDGECRVQCPVTFTKRWLTAVERFLDRRHLAAAIVVNLTALAGVAAAVEVVRRLAFGQ